MARSLGLAAYRALAQRREATFEPPDTPRPEGELIWLHAAEPDNLLAVQDLAKRLCASRQRAVAVITGPDKMAVPGSSPDGTILHTDTPGEHPQAVAAFLAYWRPSVCIWLWGGLRPNLILEADKAGVPLFLVDAETSGFDARRNRWLPDLTRELLGRFRAIVARTPAAQRRLGNLGTAKGEVGLSAPMLAGGQALACVDSDLAELATAMGGRPAWFATAVLPKELPVVLTAHRGALRWSHRLMLILNPAHLGDREALNAALAESGLSVAQWDAGQFPDDTTQVLLTEDRADWGLFFRVSPVSFMGSTLIQGENGCDPLDAAALGSAVLYGPRVRQYMQSYSRLAAAGAARIVNDADALATAVSRLIAPDQAATMAHAGWEVVSEGAAVMDRIVDLVQDALDEAGQTA